MREYAIKLSFAIRLLLNNAYKLDFLSCDLHLPLYPDRDLQISRAPIPISFSRTALVGLTEMKPVSGEFSGPFGANTLRS